MTSTRPFFIKVLQSLYQNIWWLYRARPLQLEAPSLSRSIFFFSSLATSRYLPLFSPSFSFTLWSVGTTKSTILQVLSFITITRSSRLVEIWWFVCISKSQSMLWGLFSWMDSGLSNNHLFVWLNLNFCTIPSRSPSPPSHVSSLLLLSLLLPDEFFPLV